MSAWQEYTTIVCVAGSRLAGERPAHLRIPDTQVYYGRVILTFADAGTEDLFNGRKSKAARKQLPVPLWPRARRLLDQLQRTHLVGDMAQPPGNRFERLSDGRYSVRVNDQYRVTFHWANGAAKEVWCGDYH